MEFDLRTFMRYLILVIAAVIVFFPWGALVYKKRIIQRGCSYLSDSLFNDEVVHAINNNSVSSIYLSSISINPERTDDEFINSLFDDK